MDAARITGPVVYPSGISRVDHVYSAEGFNEHDGAEANASNADDARHLSHLDLCDVFIVPICFGALLVLQ